MEKQTKEKEFEIEVIRALEKLVETGHLKKIIRKDIPYYVNSNYVKKRLKQGATMKQIDKELKAKLNKTAQEMK